MKDELFWCFLDEISKIFLCWTVNDPFAGLGWEKKGLIVSSDMVGNKERVDKWSIWDVLYYAYLFSQSFAILGFINCYMLAFALFPGLIFSLLTDRFLGSASAE